MGESGDVHPRNKILVGKRLARIALANEYGQAIPYSGPVYDSMTIKNDKVILHFTQTEGGLVAQSMPDTYIVQSESGKSCLSSHCEHSLKPATAMSNRRLNNDTKHS